MPFLLWEKLNSTISHGGGGVVRRSHIPLGLLSIASLNITVFYRINWGSSLTSSYVEVSYCPWGALTLTSFLFQHRWSCRTKNLVHWVTASLVAQTVKNLPAMWEIWVWSLGWEDPLEEGMATHSSILAWRISMDRRAWQGYSPWGHKKSDMTDWLSTEQTVLVW